MITNRYYIITIIALFLSLSLGILIGGTLGQQWINENQQKLIYHYEQKAEKLAGEKNELLKLNKELNINYEKMFGDYHKLFDRSISDSIVGMKILWINNSSNSYKRLQNTVMLAGASIEPLTNETIAFNQEFSRGGTSPSEYDVIVFFQNDKDRTTNFNWILNYNVPVIYINEGDGNLQSDFKESDLLDEKITIASLYEHYNFIFFLKSLLQESNNE